MADKNICETNIVFICPCLNAVSVAGKTSLEIVVARGIKAKGFAFQPFSSEYCVQAGASRQCWKPFCNRIIERYPIRKDDEADSHRRILFYPIKSLAASCRKNRCIGYLNTHNISGYKGIYE